MKFLVSNQDTTARIYGHTYRLKSFNNPAAGLADILVADNGSASELLNRHNDILLTASFDQRGIDTFPRLLERCDHISRGSRVMILRSGGIGDHIMLLPALLRFMENFSGSKVKLWLAVQEDMFPIYKGKSFIDRLFPLPLTMDNLIDADYFVDFSDAIERSDFNALHPTDYYMRFMGLKPNGLDKKPPGLDLSSDSSSLIKMLLKGAKDESPDRPIVLIQWLSSVRIRSFPPDKLKFLNQYYKDIIFISAHHNSQAEQSSLNIQNADLKIVDISCHIKDLSDFLTAVSLSDVVISTDSSAYHVAAAFNKPALALFGPIDSRIRTCYYPKTKSIDAEYKGETCSSPCYRHRGICPESRLLDTHHSPCLMSIPVEKIHNKFRELISEYLG